MREIVTIQVGDFANYIGSHFWNFQDELLGLADQPDADVIYKNVPVDMDLLFRAGETRQGTSTYCPRLISVGVQGSLGSLSPMGSLYEDISSSNPADIVTWKGNASRHISEPTKKNLYLQSLYEEEQDKSGFMVNDAGKQKAGTHRQIEDKARVESLENGVQFWTDFSKVHYHPQSLYELHGSWMDIQKFDNYGIGREILSQGSALEEMNERLRFFVEECDQIQGIQFIVDDSGGFTSAAAELLENIADEYQYTPVLLYSARAPSSYINFVSKREGISRAVHDSVSFSRLSSLSKLIVPLGLASLSRSNLYPLLHIKDQKLFHCSAVYAASIHSISIPFRLEILGPTANSSNAIGPMNIGELIQMLSGQARQNTVSILDVAMPAPLIDTQRQGSILKSFQSLTPEIGEDAEDSHAVEFLSIHGALHSGGHRALISQVHDSVCASYESELPKPIFSHLSATLCPLPIPLPFPSIFGSCVGRHGELSGSQTEGNQIKGSLDVDSVPVAARLRSSIAIKPYIEKRLANLRRYGIERGTRGAELLRSWGFGREEIGDMGEELAKKVMALDPQPEMSSDSD